MNEEKFEEEYPFFSKKRLFGFGLLLVYILTIILFLFAPLLGLDTQPENFLSYFQNHGWNNEVISFVVFFGMTGLLIVLKLLVMFIYYKKDEKYDKATFWLYMYSVICYLYLAMMGWIVGFHWVLMIGVGLSVLTLGSFFLDMKLFSADA